MGKGNPCSSLTSTSCEQSLYQESVSLSSGIGRLQLREFGAGLGGGVPQLHDTGRALVDGLFRRLGAGVAAPGTKMEGGGEGPAMRLGQFLGSQYLLSQDVNLF
jgi:hypothetical protein